MIKAIFACDDDWGIGKDGGLPWSNPLDLKWFSFTYFAHLSGIRAFDLVDQHGCYRMHTRLNLGLN